MRSARLHGLSAKLFPERQRIRALVKRPRAEPPIIRDLAPAQGNNKTTKSSQKRDFPSMRARWAMQAARATARPRAEGADVRSGGSNHELNKHPKPS